ncbi:hypothetical protein [Clostridium massiliamazoniense]|uniref:hypothetical protein n=1 Tax=Clostridium massiliamazoniense TaxID=1347366 RepID=UPI0012F9579D|nr:hypothetical protein [Clostridium massiliamazoniense]
MKGFNMILDRIKDYSRVILKDDNSGHDHYHAERVSKIANKENEKTRYKKA